jgi:sugar transferase (PEP-CTERM system associated)
MIRLFRVFVPTSVVGLLISEILLAFACYVAAFFLVRSEDFEMYFLYEGGAERTATVVGSLILGLYLNDLYTELRVVSKLRLVQQFCLVIGLAFLTQALLSYLDPGLILGHWQMITGSALALIVLPGWRVIYDRVAIQILNRRKVLFVGADELAISIVAELDERPQFGLSPAGYLADEPLVNGSRGLGRYLGPYTSLRVIAAEIKPDLIVVALAERRGKLPVYDLLDLRLSGIEVLDISSLYETLLWRVAVSSLKPSQLLFSHELGPNPRSLAIQRAFSYLLALCATVVLLPVMILVWILVRLTSRGAALYSQERVGLNGKVFRLFKFRSMYVDAEARTGAVWAQRDDPRVTPLGRVLRRLRLDELPQFLNVLRGEMSIVGPRPERPEFVEVLTQKIPFYGQRHAVLPGITGWAQINHSYGDSVEDTITKLEYDLYYLKHISFSLDLYVIFHTFKVMLMQKGSR